MRDEDRTGGLKPGKGTRIAVTEVALERLHATIELALRLYQECGTPEEFMAKLKLEGESTTQYSRQGRDYAAMNKWIAIPTSAGEEFRLTFSLNDQHQFTMDMRGWWGG